MSVTWGSKVKSSWRIGYELIVNTATVTSATSTASVTLKVWFKAYKRNYGESGTLTIVSDVFGMPATSKSISVKKNKSKVIYTVTQSVPLSHLSETAVAIEAQMKNISKPSNKSVGKVTGSISLPIRPYNAPASVTAATATRVSDTQTTVAWTPTSATDPDAPYSFTKVERWDNLNNNWYVVANLAGYPSSFNDTTEANRKYKYRISGGNSTAYGTPVETNYIYTTPTGLTNVQLVGQTITGAVEPKTSTVALSWEYTSSRDAAPQFRVSWTGPTSGSADVSGSSTSISGLSAGGQYSFTVKALNVGDGNDTLLGPSSNTVSVKIHPVPVAVPNVRITNQFVSGPTSPKSSTVAIAWDLQTDDTIIGYSVDVVGSGSPVVTIAGRTATITGLVSGQTYSVIVRARNAVGYSDDYDALTVKAAGLPGASPIKLFEPSGTKLKISYGIAAANGGTISKYQWKLTQNDVDVIGWTDVSPIAATLNLSGMTVGLTYRFHIRSVSEVGTGTEVALTSDEAGGYLRMWTGTAWVNRFIKTGANKQFNALVREFDGTDWRLTFSPM